jgi:hypothetical protein
LRCDANGEQTIEWPSLAVPHTDCAFGACVLIALVIMIVVLVALMQIPPFE